MRFLIVALLIGCTASAQQAEPIDLSKAVPPATGTFAPAKTEKRKRTDIRINNDQRWSLRGNKLLTGGLIFLSGAAKGFNEGLQFNYFGFEDIFPKANDNWFYPPFSFRNKYKDRDPSKGPKFFMSTSVLVMLTDQYHLNNFINRAALTAALVIKIGEGKKPLRHYLFDALYYTACYQLGFQSIYAPIKARSHH